MNGRAPAEPTMFTPELVTLLGRLEPNGQVRSAAVYTHPHGFDLRAMAGTELLYARVFTDLADSMNQAAEWRAVPPSRRRSGRALW